MQLNATSRLVKCDGALSNRQPRPPDFNRFESFDHDDLTAKHCYFSTQGLLMLMGSKFVIKDDQAAKH